MSLLRQKERETRQAEEAPRFLQHRVEFLSLTHSDRVQPNICVLRHCRQTESQTRTSRTSSWIAWSSRERRKLLQDADGKPATRAQVTEDCANKKCGPLSEHGPGYSSQSQGSVESNRTHEAHFRTLMLAFEDATGKRIVSDDEILWPGMSHGSPSRAKSKPMSRLPDTKADTRWQLGAWLRKSERTDEAMLVCISRDPSTKDKKSSSLTSCESTPLSHGTRGRVTHRNDGQFRVAVGDTMRKRQGSQKRNGEASRAPRFWQKLVAKNTRLDLQGIETISSQNLQ